MGYGIENDNPYADDFVPRDPATGQPLPLDLAHVTTVDQAPAAADDWFASNAPAASSTYNAAAAQAGSQGVAQQLNQGYQAPAGAVRNEYGYYVLPNGDLAPGQTTPGMAGFTPVDANGNILPEVQDFLDTHPITPASIDSGGGPPRTTTTGTGSGGGSGSSSGGGVSLSSFARPANEPAPTPYRPFTETFTAPTAPSDLMDTWDRSFVAPTAPADLMDTWDQSFAWDPSKIASNPAYQFRLKEEQQAVERGAAAKGTLLTGGTQKELQDRAAGVASSFMNDDYSRDLGTYNTNFNTFTADKQRRGQEFANTFGRALTGYTTDFNTFEGDKARRTDLYNSQFANARNTFLDRAGIYDRNESARFESERANRGDTFNFSRTNRMDDVAIDQDLWGRTFAQDQANFNNNRLTANDEYDRLFRFADYGANAANASAVGASNAGRSGADLITGSGNATAAGQVGSANAWGGAASSSANLAAQYLLMSKLRK